MADDVVTVEMHGGTAVLTLNVPGRRNVLSAPIVRAVAAAMDRIEADPAARAVVVTGAGRAFCAGAELSTLAAFADGDFDSVEEVYGGFLRVLRSPLPTIAAVNGPSVGAGFNLALACDLRLAGRSALFDTRFAQLRLHPGGGPVWLLARAVGQQRAMRAVLYGETWDAQAAYDAGLVSSVHPDESLVADAVALGRRLDDQEGDYVRRLTATVRSAVTTPTHDEALAAETEAQRWSSTRPAFRAGLAVIEESIARRRAENS